MYNEFSNDISFPHVEDSLLTEEEMYMKEMYMLSSDPTGELPEKKTSRLDYGSLATTLPSVSAREAAQVEAFMREHKVERIPARAPVPLLPPSRRQVKDGVLQTVYGSTGLVNEIPGENQFFSKGRTFPKNRSFLLALKQKLEAKKRGHTRDAVKGFLGTKDKDLSLWDPSLVIEQAISSNLLNSEDLEDLLGE